MADKAPADEKLCSECGKAFVPQHHRRTKCYECSPEGSSSKAKTKTSKASATAPSIQTGVSNMVAGVGAMVATAAKFHNDPGMSAKLQFDAMVIANGADPIGEAMSDVAATHPKIKAALERMMVGGSWGKLAFAVAGVAGPVAINHGWVPPGILALLQDRASQTAEEQAAWSQPDPAPQVP